MPRNDAQEHLRKNIRFEEVEHTADAAFRIYGRDMEELFVNAGHAVSFLLCENPSEISGRMGKNVNIEADDAEELLVEWLSELCFLAETKSLVFVRFVPEMVKSTRIKAKIYGDKIDRIKTHIKAVTYHNLEIMETETGIAATVVFDL